jgi:hypothetical protein
MRLPIRDVTIGLMVPICAAIGAFSCGMNADDAFGPTSDCLQYLSCIEIADADNQALYEGTYGEDGDCWGAASDALACTEACQDGLADARSTNPGIEECWPDDTPDMFLIFALVETWYWEPDPSEWFYSYMETTFQPYEPGNQFEAALSYVIDDSYEGVFDIECTETGWNWLCEDVTDSSPTHDVYSVSGSFGDSFRTGTMQLVYTNDNGTATHTWTGQPR